MGGANRRRQAVAAKRGHHAGDGRIETEAMADGDIDRLDPRTGTQHRSDHLAMIFQRHPGTAHIRHILMPAA